MTEMTQQSLPKITVAEFIAERLASSGRTQREIADECGFENPNILSMFKSAAAKVPMNRIGPLAKALDADAAHLLRLVMSEYVPDTWQALETIMQGTVLTANELDLVRRFRVVTGDQNPAPLAMTRMPGARYAFMTQ